MGNFDERQWGISVSAVTMTVNMAGRQRGIGFMTQAGGQRAARQSSKLPEIVSLEEEEEEEEEEEAWVLAESCAEACPFSQARAADPNPMRSKIVHRAPMTLCGRRGFTHLRTFRTGRQSRPIVCFALVN